MLTQARATGITATEMNRAAPEIPTATIVDILRDLRDSGKAWLDLNTNCWHFIAKRLEGSPRRLEIKGTTQRERILNFIAEHPNGVRQPEVTAALHIPRNSTWTLLSMLKKEGAIIAKRDPVNHSQRVYFLKENAPEGDPPIDPEDPAPYRVPADDVTIEQKPHEGLDELPSGMVSFTVKTKDRIMNEIHIIGRLEDIRPLLDEVMEIYADAIKAIPN